MNVRAAILLALAISPLSVALAPAADALKNQTVPAVDSAPGKWIDVPYVAQPKDGCGAAVISMIMGYWAAQPGAAAALPRPGVREIQSRLFVPAEKGIPASAMRGYFEHNGYRAYAFRGDWSDLERNISQGRPLIVSLAASGRRGPLHYAVVAGIDSQRNFVFLNDPARGKMLRISREGFLAEWNAANHWTLLVIPASGD